MIRTLERACILSILILSLPNIATADPEVDPTLEGLPIIAIHIDRKDIFDTSDPKTKAWFYRWANALHIISKEDFIRSMLLFKEDDAFSASRAAESARMLRGLGIMNPVNITAHRVDGGVDVMVETRDQWTLKAGASLGVFGSNASYKVDVEEENLLGWGKAVSVAYESDIERDSWSLGYFDPNVFNSRWRVNLAHATYSDGFSDRVVVDRPFYSLATPWTWGVSGLRKELNDHLYSQSESVVEGLHESERLSVWGGARLPGGGHITRRLIAGWDYSQNLYSDWMWEDTGTPYPQPEDRLISGPRLSFEQVVDRFIVVEGFRAWTVQEDVPLGPNFSLTTIFSAPRFGGDRERLLMAGRAHAASQRGRWLLLGDTWLSGRLEDGSTHNLVAGLQIGAAQLGISGWQIRLFVEGSRRLDRDRQLTLGADIGLRGWDPNYFDGTGRALLNVQWRKLLKKELLGLFSFGIVFFGDAGKTWDPRVGPDTDGVRFDAGAGLLFDLSHIGRSTLLRVDAAVPDDGTGVTVTISTSTIFRLPKRWR
ncbi:MAG: hypothetical protein IFK93_02935 [Acidobacteria bacterium]|nr:hypothetical protein [Candidatus Sulfomarinibacter kjeldsenii]